MIKQFATRRFSTVPHYTVVKGKVANPNVTPHNPEHRPG